MITLHHLSQSRSFRIVWLLEELKNEYGIDYQLVSHQRNQHSLAPDELQQIHPMGKAPILVDDALPIGEQALAESAVIIEYLLKFYDKNQLFSPKDDINSWRDYHFWLHFAEGSLMPPLVMKLILSKAVTKSPFFARPIVKQVKMGAEKMLLNANITKALSLLEAHLTNRAYLVDERLTGADIMLYFSVLGAKKSQPAFHYPNINRWLALCESRFAFHQAVMVGGQAL